MGRNGASPAKQKKQGGEANCLDCRHYYITYDPSFPYGCRAAGFKSRLFPAKAVYVNSGSHCLLFTEKDKSR